jgi:hypothetical protein
LERIGIRSPKDLLTYDHHKFWKERLILKAVDLNRFGRQYNRNVLGRGHRRAWVDKLPTGLIYNFDRRTAGLIWHSSDSIQHLIDEYRNCVDMKYCLVDVDVEHLLPQVADNTAAVGKNKIGEIQRVTSVYSYLSPYIIDPIPPISRLANNNSRGAL